MRWVALLGVVVVAACAVASSEVAVATGAGHTGRVSRVTSAARARRLCAAAKRRGLVPERDVCSDALRADIEGDGRSDLVLLYSRPITGAGASLKAGPETLKVVPGSGATVEVSLRPAIPRPGIVAVGDVNASAGDELFVYGSWISSGADVDVFSFQAGRLVRAAPHLSFGADSADKSGFDCVRKPVPEIIQRFYSLVGPTIYGGWRMSTYTYAWRGASLRLVRRSTALHHGLPSRSATRPGPGCDPLPAFR